MSIGNEFSVSLKSTKPDDVLMCPTAPASRAVCGLKKSGRVIGMTKGQFSMIDLIRALLDKTGPAHLQLSTWTAGIRDANNAAFLLKRGKLLSARLLVDRSFATRKPQYCAAVRSIFGDDAIRCTNTHAKIALLKNESWSVAVRSSMNLNHNPRFENFDIDDNETIYSLFDRHFAEMETETPPGLYVSNSQIGAIFERAGRGLNVFNEVDEGWAIEQGAPIQDPLEFRGWILDEYAKNRKRKHGPKNAKELAKRLGLESSGDLNARLENDPARSLMIDAIIAVKSK